MSKCCNILPTRSSFFISSARKLERVKELKKNFSSCCFIAGDSRVKIVWLHVAVFTELDILHFWNNFCPFIKILSGENTSKLL